MRASHYTMPSVCVDTLTESIVELNEFDIDMQLIYSFQPFIYMRVNHFLFLDLFN